VIGVVIIRGGAGGIDHCDPRTDGRRGGANGPVYIPNSRMPIGVLPVFRTTRIRAVQRSRNSPSEHAGGSNSEGPGEITGPLGFQRRFNAAAERGVPDRRAAPLSRR
jgi:hypothetical protein